LFEAARDLLGVSVGIVAVGEDPDGVGLARVESRSTAIGHDSRRAWELWVVQSHERTLRRLRRPSGCVGEGADARSRVAVEAAPNDALLDRAKRTVSVRGNSAGGVKDGSLC
jgi:hypothetical protein